MSQVKYRIDTVGGPPRVVSAEAAGPFGIRRESRGCWVVDHRATGCRVVACRSRRDARAVTRELSRWTAAADLRSPDRNRVAAAIAFGAGYPMVCKVRHGFDFDAPLSPEDAAVVADDVRAARDHWAPRAAAVGGA